MTCTSFIIEHGRNSRKKTFIGYDRNNNNFNRVTVRHTCAHSDNETAHLRKANRYLAIKNPMCICRRLCGC